MTSATSINDFWPALEGTTSDGRRQRSDRSRQKIIKAMFSLLREGDMSPSAVSVADRASVGLRTVFRHFEDMDSIYNEMTEQIFEAITPHIDEPFHSEGWQNQLMEMIEKRSGIYEMIFPVKVSMSLRRFQSAFLQEQYDRDLKLMRTKLKSILPQSVAKDAHLFAALEVTLGFSTWRRLRQDQKLSASNAKKVIMTMLNGLIANVDAE